MKKPARIVTLFFLLMVTVSAGLVVWQLWPWRSPGALVNITIEPGATVTTITRKLEQNRVVPSSLVLRLYIRLCGTDRSIQAGHYTFIEHEGVLAAAQKLLHGKPDEKSITITEGLTIDQVAQIFYESSGVDTAEFFALCNDRQLINTVDSSALSLEGYLFPDTYKFGDRVSAREIVVTMINRFLEKTAQLPPRIKSKPPLSLHQMVILASIVEKEAVLANERPIIASVFYNRLRLGWPLGADPTVRYIYKKYSGDLRVSELNSESPYNTRRFAGLPPGPICSPGFAALKATAQPATTDELFFVARWDGSGAHDFSRTNAEHAQKKMLIREYNEQRIRTMTKPAVKEAL